MFTVKLYGQNGATMTIIEAERVFIRRDPPQAKDAPTWTELTIYHKAGSVRYDVGQSPHHPDGGVWERGFVENAAGRTTEVL